MPRSTYGSLVSYPPDNLYPFKKPWDVPKMTPGDHSTYRYSKYSSGGDTVLEQLSLVLLNIYAESSLCRTLDVSASPDLLTRDGTVGRCNGTHAPTTEFSSALYAFGGNLKLYVIWSASRITR